MTVDEMVGALAGQLAEDIVEDEVRPGSLLDAILHKEPDVAGPYLVYCICRRFGVDSATADEVAAKLGDVIALVGGSLADIDEL